MSPEQPTQHSEQLEVPLGVSQASPEVGSFEAGAERFEQRSEGQLQAGAPVALPPVAVSSTAQPADQSAVVKLTTSNNPATAKDSDSIEKEWIDRVKQTLKDTKDDPYKKEEEVKIIKMDYLEKRYNRKLRNEE